MPMDARIDGLLVKFEKWRNRDKKQKGPRIVRVKVLAYWPADEWDAMAERWPQFVPEYGDDPETHRRTVNDMLEAHAENSDATLAIAMMSVDGLTEFAKETGADPASSETRAAYAQQLGSDHLATPWPPALRQKCWCGSGKSFRECCSATSK
jgi:hypothetical protein